MTKRLGAPLFLLLSSACGCTLLAPVADPGRYYVLTAGEASEEVGTPLRGVSLGIGPVEIPGYLRRPEIVRRTAATEVSPSTAERWAGSLEANISRVLGENLSALLGTERIWSYPSYEVTRADYLIEIDFSRFDLDEHNAANVTARWQVRAQGEDDPRGVSRETRSVQQAGSAATADGIEALSRGLVDLSVDIASAVRELEQRRRR
jgi:uncharacterized lipoprotein YmbA